MNKTVIDSNNIHTSSLSNLMNFTNGKDHKEYV